MIFLLFISGYAGHGAQSVPPETLAKYAATPLPAEVTREIQAMMDVRGIGGGIASQDGKSVYFTWNVTGIRQVWAVDGPMKFPRQLTGGEDATHVAGVAPNGKYIVVQRDRRGEENPGLYLQAVQGGALELIQHTPNVQTSLQLITQDSRYVYYRANDVKPNAYAIYRYDTTTKKKEAVFGTAGIGETSLWRLSDYKNGKLLLAKEVGSNMTEFYEFDEAKKTVVPLFGQNEREDFEALYGAGDDILVQTPKLSDFRRLYTWKGGKFTAVSPDVKADLANFTINDDRTKIALQWSDKGYGKTQLLDAKTFKPLAPVITPKVDNVHLGQFSGRYLTVVLDSSRLVPSLFVLDTETNALTQWVQASSPEIDVNRFADVTLESYPARDGTQVPAFVRRPVTCPKKPCPVIVAFHGGPEAQATAGFSAGAQIWVDQGFIFVEPNVRGSDGYGKAWIHADDGEKRLKVVTDIEDAAKWAKKTFAEGGVAPKVGIYGGSYGGYSAMAGMTMFAGAYDAGISVVGISNLLTFLENTAPYRRALRVSEYGDPVKDRDALLKLSPITHLDKVKAPLFIVQGATDPRVPAGEAIQMYEAMQKKGLPSKLVIFGDEGHGVQKRENRVLYLGHAVRFFKEQLMGAAPPRT